MSRIGGPCGQSRTQDQSIGSVGVVAASPTHFDKAGAAYRARAASLLARNLQKHRAVAPRLRGREPSRCQQRRPRRPGALSGIDGQRQNFRLIRCDATQDHAAARTNQPEHAGQRKLQRDRRRAPTPRWAETRSGGLPPSPRRAARSRFQSIRREVQAPCGATYCAGALGGGRSPPRQPCLGRVDIERLRRQRRQFAPAGAVPRPPRHGAATANRASVSMTSHRLRAPGVRRPACARPPAIASLPWGRPAGHPARARRSRRRARERCVPAGCRSPTTGAAPPRWRQSVGHRLADRDPHHRDARPPGRCQCAGRARADAGELTGTRSVTATRSSAATFPPAARSLAQHSCAITGSSAAWPAHRIGCGTRDEPIIDDDAAVQRASAASRARIRIGRKKKADYRGDAEHAEKAKMRSARSAKYTFSACSASPRQFPFL